MNAALILDNSCWLPVELGDSPYDAILDVVHACEAQGRRPVRIAAGDWVTLADIAQRVGVCRELVRLWSVGKQGPGGFPPPLNPSAKTHFYSWIEASAWVRRHTRYDAGDESEPVLAAMNLALQLRAMAPQLTRLDAVVKCIVK